MLPVNLPNGYASIYGQASVYGITSTNGFIQFGMIQQIGGEQDGFSVGQSVMFLLNQPPVILNYDNTDFFLVKQSDILLTEHENPPPVT